MSTSTSNPSRIDPTTRSDRLLGNTAFREEPRQRGRWFAVRVVHEAGGPREREQRRRERQRQAHGRAQRAGAGAGSPGERGADGRCAAVGGNGKALPLIGLLGLHVMYPAHR